jgi:hypothetical protein
MGLLWKSKRGLCQTFEWLRCPQGRLPPQLWCYTGLLERASRHVDAFVAPSRVP